jgi:carbohydrate kinase (thermoresistant glucokinase family)
MNDPGPAIVVMGVAGSGKTTVGEALAARMGVAFRDADEFHPQANVAKMAAGIPLTDEDRWPWLDAIARAMRAAAPAGIVVACSALKHMYRARLRMVAARPLVFVHLDGPKEILAERIGGRRGHFMPASLLDSQIATLEPLRGDEGFAVSIDQPVAAIVDEVIQTFTDGGRPG